MVCLESTGHLLSAPDAPTDTWGKVQRGRKRAAAPVAVESLESRTLCSHTWFVSPGGSDINPGTITRPLKTIQAAANIAQPGDTVDIRAGVYRETVTPRHSGTSSAPITFTAYSNEKVIIDGANPVTGWKHVAGAIWSAPLPGRLAYGYNEIFLDGVMLNETRYPAATQNVSHPAFSTVASATHTWNTTTIHDPHLTQGNGYWVGARFNIAAGPGWIYSGGIVTASGPGWFTATYSTSNAYEIPRAGNTYYLSGLPAKLSGPGQWALSGSQLLVWTPGGDSPALHHVEAKSRAFAFDLRNVAYINIQNLHLFANNIRTSVVSRSVHIDRITDQYTSQYPTAANGWIAPPDSGISLDGANSSLTNSVIAFSPGNGVFAIAPGIQIINNVIHDVDYLGGDSAGVYILSANVTVQNNTIYNCGRSGINIRASHDLILHNSVHDFGLQTSDCGGIYTFGLNGAGTRIAYNQVYNGITPGFGGTGILLDNNSSHFIVDHNITWAVNTGLKMNLSSEYNEIVNNTLCGIDWSVYKTYAPANWGGTIIENNIFSHAVYFGQYARIANNLVNFWQFVNAADDDFAPLSGSAAVNRGYVISPYTNGYAGRAPEIGAVELGIATSSYGAPGALPLMPPFSSWPI